MIEEESEDEDSADDDNELDQADESTNYNESDLKSFRQQVDAELKSDAIKVTPVATKSNYDTIANYIQSLAIGSHHVETDAPGPIADPALTEELNKIHPTATLPLAATDDNDDAASTGSGVSSTDLQEAADDLADLDPNSREYRYKMVEKVLSDARSQRSYSTNASTIAPSVIKEKIKRSIELKEQREVRKRCLAKGEANATTRGRKENKETVKEYAGWDF